MINKSTIEHVIEIIWSIIQIDFPVNLEILRAFNYNLRCVQTYHDGATINSIVS